MWQCFGVLRVKRQKASLNRQPSAYTCGGARFSPNTSHVIGNKHSRWIIRLTLRSAQNFIFYKQICCTQYFTILFWDWGRRWVARIDSRWYSLLQYIKFNLLHAFATVKCKDKSTIILRSFERWILYTPPYMYYWRLYEVSSTKWRLFHPQGRRAVIIYNLLYTPDNHLFIPREYFLRK